MTTPLLNVRGLTVDVPGKRTTRRVLHGVDLCVAAGEAVALVREPA